jgi:light-regulated signal transduction histidine kinase (bacteriophytochrome)
MAERVNALCKRVFETGEPAEIEHTNLLPRGQVTSRTQFQLLPAYQVSRERILGISEDISSRRHTEELLQAYSRELQRSNRELENFAHIASHDLQEPLRKVQAFGDRLKTRYADVLDETGRDYLERMQGAARRMQTLIQDLLAYSRVTSKAESFEPVDLRDVAERVVQDLSTRVDRTGGQVIIECLPKVEADPLQMRQLFQNLIANALKFHREGVPPLVTISGEALHGTAEIRVADNGIGFEMEYAERMFRLFERLHGRMQYEGTGIGLPIVQKIVERHGGSIRAESAPGAGATFVVRLPIHQNDTIRTT